MCDRGARLVAAIAAMMLLQGCLAGFGSGKAEQRVSVTRGGIVIAGPAGFCIDGASLRNRADGTFVLLASCAALTGAPDAPHPPIPGVLSAMVSEGPDGVGLAESLPEIADYLSSETGRAALSRTGDPESVAVLQSRIAGGVLFLNLRDDSDFDGPAIEPEYWRAVFAARGHIVTLSAMAPAGQPAIGALAKLEAFVARVAQENAGSRAGAPPRGPAPPPANPARVREAAVPRPLAAG
jgi:hypothetical protein